MDNTTVQNNNKPTLNESCADTFGKNESNKYSIYNYFKKNPATLVAVFSGAIAVITFLSQLLAYIVSKNTLEFWNYDSAYASFGKNNLLYSTIAAIVYLIVTSFTIIWFIKTCDVYLERKKKYTLLELKRKQLRRNGKNLSKEAREIKKGLNARTQKLQVDKIESDIQAGQQTLYYFGKIIRRKKVEAYFSFVVNILPILLLLFFFSIIFSYMIVLKEEMPQNVFGILIVQLLCYLFLFVMEHKVKINRKILKQIISEKEFSEVYDSEIQEKEYPIFALLIKGEGITNSVFITEVISVFLAIIILVSSYSLGITNTEQAKKDFQIANIDGEQYAVVYFVDDTYFLEKAIIVDDSLMVFTREQRIISASDISFSIRTFDKVVKIDREVSQ